MDTPYKWWTWTNQMDVHWQAEHIARGYWVWVSQQKETHCLAEAQNKCLFSWFSSSVVNAIDFLSEEVKHDDFADSEGTV